MSISYLDVFEISDLPEHKDDIRVGDVVCSSGNAFPQHCVIAIHGDKVWVRNLATGVDGIATMARCRKVAGANQEHGKSPHSSSRPE